MYQGSYYLGNRKQKEQANLISFFPEKFAGHAKIGEIR
jgi:hypothetical protein